MAIHPRYFGREVPNNSSDFDAYKWNAEGRKNAALYIKNDPRNHPHLQGNLDLDWQVLVGRPGPVMTTVTGLSDTTFQLRVGAWSTPLVMTDVLSTRVVPAMLGNGGWVVGVMT